jgi:hypothetical protein
MSISFDNLFTYGVLSFFLLLVVPNSQGKLVQLNSEISEKHNKDFFNRLGRFRDAENGRF